MLIVIGCKVAKQRDQYGKSYKIPVKYNFKFIGYDFDISNPENDRRSYYKVFIDKVEIGRTTTGLESQEKIFETELSFNRHLLTIEKWILDERAGKYVKLNNIAQPKPNFLYFTVPGDRIVIITMKSRKNGRTVFSEDFEIEN